MTDEQPKPRVFTVDAAAAEAGVSRSSIYRLIRSGVLETVCVSGVAGSSRQRITEKSLRAYIAAHRPKYEVVHKTRTPAKSSED